MSETKDYERQASYDAETAAFAATSWEAVLDFAELYNLAQLIFTSELWLIETGGRSVALNRGRRNQKHSSASALLGEVKLSVGGCTIATLAHELAHIAAGPAAVGHGSRWRALYLAMLHIMGAPDAALRLRTQFVERYLHVDDLAYDLGVDNAVARKVAALLDKAASTTFTAEGEAFTTKALALMAAHRLDDAVVAGFRSGSGDSSDDAIVEKVLWLDAGPFVNPRTLLLDAIARENSCRVLFSTGRWGRRVEVIGMRRDVADTLSLFSMLTTHAVAEMMAQPARGNTLAFRRSFLVGYTDRTYERLRAARRQAVATVAESVGDEAASAALVALNARANRVDEHVRAHHGRVRSQSLNAAAGEGYGAGVSAADRAPLGQRSLPRVKALNR